MALEVLLRNANIPFLADVGFSGSSVVDKRLKIDLSVCLAVAMYVQPSGMCCRRKFDKMGIAL